MSRLIRIGLGAALLSGLLAVAGVASPRLAFACSCDSTRSANFQGGEDAVLLGRVGNDVGRGRFAFHVERWFKGGAEPVVEVHSATVPLGGGRFSYNTCGLDFATGEHLILAAAWWEGALSPSACQPHASVESAQGQRFIAMASGMFGPGVAVGDPPPEGDPGPGLNLAQLANAAVLFVVGVVLIVVIVASFRRRATPETRS